MLLNDIGKSPDATFRRINRHLDANYGFKITEDVSDKDLLSIIEQIEEEITELKIKGDDASASPEISKRLLVLEGLRSLREFSFDNFQSPKLETVIGNLVDAVVHIFEISGLSQADFDRAVHRTMDEYRSSEYRFPDKMVEQRVRQDALGRLQAKDESVPPIMEQDESTIAAEDEELAGVSEEATVDEDRENEFSANQELANNIRNPHKPYDSTKEQIPMVRDRNGRMVPDPFAVHAAERRKGIVMKEHNSLVKNLRRLLETEVSQAEVMMAAKGFAQELQEMVEKIGRLQNEDLPPVTDQMRETYGMESASAFQTQIYGALQGVMDSLYTAKGQVDDAVGNMASTGRVLAQVDMDKDINDTQSPSDDGIGTDLDNLAPENNNDLGAEAADEFGGAEAEDPLGREMKTESIKLKRKILEMKRLVAKACKIRESSK